METAPYIARRPKRADGRRNYDAILTAARAAFDAHGSGASLEEIAAEAQVAIGTLYRHFPTRAALVEAATRDGLDALIAEAAELSGHADPLAALTRWTRSAVRHISTFRGLVGILSEAMYDEGTPSHAACAAMHQGAAELLTAAQEAGRVRPDLTPDELFDLLTAAAWIREHATSRPEAGPRVLELMLEGIAAGPAARS
ncbi:TetR/AcrR family transcriptional regulator [Streptomyces albidoflavus]|uniref:TetR family transcriptional regulator n=2 Tax=Streptomyces albidoflavus TaxID=1886 RepID=A0A8G2E2E8_9ACTN|nr:TetR/AcrR family transcriptional regulator [Streptomyces albidoflavus]RZE16649.1 TetR family transcriptional regulator [Streptomyces albidoflavus]RZE52309.1 TetR family transcriptional regulator [Streptomyces albidoflavus]WTB66195.1 TetR/AcrR family transcriptional regulator [Streptomyces albidoflavus]WTB74424.1 TetR/AcrR family transcriptional regulator [Streptomyces albidoflavus]